MHPWLRGGDHCIADPARRRGHCCMEDFAGRVARFLNQAEGGPRQAAHPCSLLMRVHMATMRLLDGDAMRCRTQQELHVDWRDRVQRARC